MLSEPLVKLNSVYVKVQEALLHLRGDLLVGDTGVVGKAIGGTARIFDAPAFYAQQVRQILRKYGTDAHVFVPGVGYMNGFAAGNYLESTGQTNAAVDGAVGLVLDAAGSVGAELVAGQNWTTSSANTSISGGNTVVFNGAASGAVGTASIPAVLNKTYQITFTVSGLTAGQIGVDAGGASTYPNIGANGTHTIRTVCTGGAGNVYVVSKAAGTTASVQVTSIREVTGTHATQATTANKPILRCGIVNLALNNGSPNGASYSRVNAAVTENYATAPDGTQTAHRLQITAANGALQQSRPELDTKTYSQGVWVKSNTGANQQFQWWNGTATITGTATAEWQLVCSGASLFTAGARFDFGSVTNGADLLIWRPGLFQGTLTAQQIIAAGGIPLTTTAPASSQYGAYAWQFDGSNDVLSLPGPLFQMADDHCVVAAGTTNGNGSIATVLTSTGGSSVGYFELDFAGTSNYPRAIWKDDAGTQVTLSDVAVYPAGCVMSGRKVGNSKTFRVNGTQKGVDSSSMAASVWTTSVIGARYNSSLNSFHSGLIYPIVAIKGTVSDSELRVLEKWLGSIAGVSIA